MADAAEQIVKQAAENVTETLTGAKVPATPEGAAVAYGSLIFMAMLPIFFGAFRSVKHQNDQKVSAELLQTPGLSIEQYKLHVIIIIVIHPHHTLHIDIFQHFHAFVLCYKLLYVQFNTSFFRIRPPAKNWNV